MSTVLAAAPGFASVSREVPLAEGAREVLTIELRPLAPPAPVTSVEPPPSGGVVSSATTTSAGVASTPIPTSPERQGRADSTALAAYVVLGTGGASLIAGVVAGGFAIGQRQDAAESCGSIEFEAGRCRSDLAGPLNDARLSAGVSTAAFVISGLALAAGATLLILNKTRSRAASVRVSPGQVSAQIVF
ncbi:MAG: hypothetical protein R3F14_07045 [Polyangiaceae bacterium]